MSYTQTDRIISISTPLGNDALLLRAFTGYEAISQLFRFDLDLLSEKPAISFDSIVGKPVTLNAVLADGSERYWSGYVSRFTQGANDGRFTSYRAEMVPWLWFLTRTADCRIFQNKKAPDIIQAIFQDLGFTDFSPRLHGNFVERDYCVQYRETDFNFVSRLMEEEGIYYFFEHANGKHTLVLANDPGEHKPCAHQSTVRYELTAGGWQDDDVVLECSAQQEFRTGAWAHTDYNFETPSTSLMVQASGKNKYEIYDFPVFARKIVNLVLVLNRRLNHQARARCLKVVVRMRPGAGSKFLLRRTFQHHVVVLPSSRRQFVANRGLMRTRFVLARIVRQHQRVLSIGVFEEIVDALFFHEARYEIEIRFPILDAVVPLHEIAVQAWREIREAQVLEDRLDDVGRLLVLKDPAVRRPSEEPQPWNHLGPIGSEPAIVCALGEAADVSAPVAVRAVGEHRGQRDCLADDAVEGNCRLFRKQIQIESEELRDRLVSCERPQQ